AGDWAGAHRPAQSREPYRGCFGVTQSDAMWAPSGGVCLCLIPQRGTAESQEGAQGGYAIRGTRETPLPPRFLTAYIARSAATIKSLTELLRSMPTTPKLPVVATSWSPIETGCSRKACASRSASVLASSRDEEV